MASSSITLIESSDKSGFLRRKKISKVVSMTYISSVSGADSNQPLKSCMSSSNLSAITAPQQPTIRTRTRRSVSFSDIEIREYEIALSDNPSVRAGPPIGLGWKYVPAAIINVDDYEEQRGPRRSRQEFLIPRFLREEKLKDFGVSQSEISQRVKDVEKAKRNRSATMRSTENMEHVHEAMESAGRKVKRLFGLRKKVDLMPSYIIDDPGASGSIKTAYSLNDLEEMVLVSTLSPKYQSVSQAKSCGNFSGLITGCDEMHDSVLKVTTAMSLEDATPPEVLKITSLSGRADVDATAEEEEDPLSF